MTDDGALGGREEEYNGEGDGGKGRKVLSVVVPPSKRTTFFWQMSNATTFLTRGL
jgi:hypothetical protein